jgi:hypothetical protein
MRSKWRVFKRSDGFWIVLRDGRMREIHQTHREACRSIAQQEGALMAH